MQRVPPPIVSAEQWAALRGYMESITGMDLAGGRVQRLRDAVIRVLGRGDLPQHMETLLADPDLRSRFIEGLTAELTVGESFFFRNPHHFDALRTDVLPRILAHNASRREIRVWSAGCAGGEEPYSLAILLDQVVPSAEGWQVSVLGTDLNPNFVERGRQGFYRPWSFRQTQIHNDARYFTAVPGGYQIREHCRGYVRFAYLNLVRDAFPSPLNGTFGLDLILFRNVAIYLQPEVTLALLSRFYQALRPGGWLLLGETELNLTPPLEFAVHRFGQATFHQKPRDARDHAPTNRLSPLPRQVSRYPIQVGGLPLVPEVPAWSPLDVAPRSTPAHLGPGESARSSAPVPASSASDPLADIRRLLANAETTEARQQLQLCLHRHPLLIEGHILQAALAEDVGELRAAEDAYRRALYIDRNCCIAHLHLAMVQQQLGDHVGSQRSLRTLLRLIDHKPAAEPVEFGDGVCYGRLREMALLIQGGIA